MKFLVYLKTKGLKKTYQSRAKISVALSDIPKRKNPELNIKEKIPANSSMPFLTRRKISITRKFRWP